MTTIRVGAVWRASLTVLICCTAGCDSEAPSRATLEALIRQGAHRDEVAPQLGAGYELFEKSDPFSWEPVERQSRDGQSAWHREFREKAQRYPKVMFHTTAWTMTWVFLDERDIARDYWQGSQ